MNVHDVSMTQAKGPFPLCARDLEMNGRKVAVPVGNKMLKLLDGHAGVMVSINGPGARPTNKMLKTYYVIDNRTVLSAYCK